MNTAEEVYRNTQKLPEPYALEVLHFSEFLTFKNQALDKKIQQGIEQADKGLKIALDNNYVDNLNKRVAERLAVSRDG